MKLNKLLLIALLTINFVSAIAQKAEWKQASSAGYTYKYVTGDPMGARFYTLKNGLSVILTQNKKEPRVAVRIAVRTGSNNDPKDHTGLAHYLEHLLFKGTDKFGSLDWSKEKPLLDKIDGLYEQYNSTKDEAKRKEIYKEIDKVSGEAAKFAIAGEYDRMMAALGSQNTNAGTFVESTIYNEDIPSNAIDKFLTVQAERFRNPILRIFHTELEAVYEEKNRGLDNDAIKMQEAMFSTLYPTHNYGVQTTIGTIEHLKNPSIKAIREYYYKYYVPNNMSVIMAGDFDADQVIKLIDQKFGYMKPGKFDEYKGPVEKPINGPIVKEVFGPTSESMRILFRSAPSNTRDAMLTSIVSSILTNGKAGLLDLNLNKLQKTQGAGASNWQFKDGGIFFVSASPKQGQTLEEVRDLILEQINILKKGSFDESLLKAIVANYKLGQLQSLENNTARAENIADEFIKNRAEKWNEEVALLDDMRKVTKKEIVDFANRFFTDKNYVLLYKRKGEDKSIVKVEKPAITPVETNAGKVSDFVKTITETPLPPVKPLWLDYSKDLQKGKIGDADVLYVQNNENGLFRLSYRFDMGSWNNKKLALATQYLQFLGTDKYTSEEISKEFYNLACNFSVNTGNEETTVTISGLEENFDKAVTLFEHLIRNAKTDENALAGLKNRMLRSRANNKLNKGAIAAALRSYATYGPNNPYNYTLTDGEINNLKAEELTGLLHSLLDHKHTVIYYGPKPLNTLTASLKNLHKLPSSWAANPAGVTFTRTRQDKNQVLFADYDAVQAEIYWVKNLNAYDPKEEAIVNLFNNYFGGGGMGSIVFQTIRESKALAYSTYAVVQTPGKKEEPYAVVAYVGSQADKLNEAVAGMNELLNDLPKTEQNFINSRKSVVKDLETERITKDAIIYSYINAQKKGLSNDIRKEIYDAYSKLTVNDLYNYHQKVLAKQPYTYCVVASEKRVSLDDLKKFGEVKQLGLTELFGY